jgi:hypothetical protein
MYSLQFPAGLKMSMAMPLLDIFLKECKSIYKRDTCTLVFIPAVCIIAKLWNQPNN